MFSCVCVCVFYRSRRQRVLSFTSQYTPSECKGCVCLGTARVFTHCHSTMAGDVVACSVCSGRATVVTGIYVAIVEDTRIQCADARTHQVARTHICAHVDAETHVHLSKYALIHTRSRARTHTHTHIHTRTRVRKHACAHAHACELSLSLSLSPPPPPPPPLTQTHIHRHARGIACAYARTQSRM